VKPREKDDDEERIWMTNRVVDGGAKVVGENPSIQANPSTSSHPILEEVLLPQDMSTIVENEQEEVASEEPLNKMKLTIKFRSILWCLILEYTRASKEIILWTTSWVASREG
jgi:hypothetical protein